MTADDFRDVALALPDVEDSARMGHADFRVRGTVLAMLWKPPAVEAPTRGSR